MMGSMEYGIGIWRDPSSSDIVIEGPHLKV